MRWNSTVLVLRKSAAATSLLIFGRAAVRETRTLAPDVVLMDVPMPDLDGISATREIVAAAPDAKVVILTTFEQDDYVFGADRTDPHDRGRRPLLSPSVTRTVVQRMAREPAPDPTAEAA